VHHPSSSRFLALVLALPLALAAQDPPALELAAAAGATAEDLPLQAEAHGRSASDASIFARRDARTITLRIPAPRGQITDRNGLPIAQSEVVYQVALQYRQFENADEDFIVQWGRTRLEALEQLIKNPLTRTDEELHDHYRHRRWLPLLVSGQIGEKEARALEPKLTAGLVLHPVYRRRYPEADLGAHVFGYTGSVGKLPTGPINFNEPLWEESEGRAGLELLYDEVLTGEPGQKRLIFDESGNKLLEEQTKRPRPGGTVVTTINLKWQKRAENVLKNGCQRGAFVVIDVVTGEVLVMASRPSFDLNSFIPGISEADFEALKTNPASPLIGRAFQGRYPPASAYKPIVALAALNNGVVTEHSTIYCPASLQIGNATMRNWSSTPEGSINVKRAIARSTNTWFYQIGIKTGPEPFLDLSRRLGMGSVSGLPLVDEYPGLIPTHDYMLRVHKRRILNGDTANMSIGQGSLLASPLQVAQAMAGIANGGALPKLQMIRQVQDTRGRVVRAMVPERRNWLGVDENAVRIVREGMRDVVSGGGGTGSRAALSYTSLCGKTGTAHWGPPRLNQRLAWFAGFLPYDNPRYAFAVLYEGRPGETVSGGRMAAPMVKSFFEPLKDELKDVIAPPQRALVVGAEPEGEDDADDEAAPRAIPVEPDDLLPLDGIGFDDGTSMIVPDPPLAEAIPEVIPAAIPVDESALFDADDEEP